MVPRNLDRQHSSSLQDTATDLQGKTAEGLEELVKAADRLADRIAKVVDHFQPENQGALLQIELDKQKLELERQQLALQRERLELAKTRINYITKLANKIIDVLAPETDQATRAAMISAILPDLLELQNREESELTLSVSQIGEEDLAAQKSEDLAHKQRRSLLKRIRAHRKHMQQDAEELAHALNLPREAVYDVLAVSYGQDPTASEEELQTLQPGAEKHPIGIQSVQQAGLREAPGVNLRDIKYHSCPIDDDEEGILLSDLEETVPEMDEDGNYLYYCHSGHTFTIDEEESDYYASYRHDNAKRAMTHGSMPNNPFPHSVQHHD